MHPMIFATFNFYRKILLRFPEGKLNGMKGYYYITIKLEKLRKSHFLIRCNSKLDIQKRNRLLAKNGIDSIANFGN